MRLIDADELEKEFCHGCQYEHNKYVNCIDCAVANAPTVDAVQVVRCKDCKHFDELHDNIGVCTYARGRKVYYDVRGIISGDWYCADWEKREI